MSKVRISTLCENTAGIHGLTGEWGLGILVEYESNKILFDTGLSDSVIRNAREMEIDLGTISKIVLSHGHGDHTGGIRYLLKELRKKVDIHAHPNIWDKKYSIRPEISEEQINFIGIPYRQEELEYLGARFHLSKEPVRLNRFMITTGEIPMITEYEEVDKNLFVRNEIGYQPDSVPDDLSLVIETPTGLVVILGCSHRGMINHLLQARKITGTKKVKAVIGGTHLFRTDEQKLEQSIMQLEEMGVEKIGVSHCTGMKTSIKLAHRFMDRFFFNNAGTVIEL